MLDRRYPTHSCLSITAKIGHENALGRWLAQQLNEAHHYPKIGHASKKLDMYQQAVACVGNPQVIVLPGPHPLSVFQSVHGSKTWS